MDEATPQGVDLSGLHREIDKLKKQLCHCGYQGTCVACRGYEMLREQAQMVTAAANQPVLVQVAQQASIEATMKDLMERMGGIQEKVQSDPQAQELMSRLVDRIQEDLGGPEAMQKLISEITGAGGLFGNFGPGGPFTPPPDNPFGVPDPDAPTDE